MLSVLIGLLLVATTISAPPVLAVTDLTTGDAIVCRTLSDNQAIVLVYIHSMYGGEVRETFVAAPDGGLRRIAMTTENAAAAEYYAHDGAVARVGNRFRVLAPVATYDEIVVRVDRVGEHELLIDGESIDLLAAAGDRHQVKLRLTRGTLMDLIFGRLC